MEKNSNDLLKSKKLSEIDFQKYNPVQYLPQEIHNFIGDIADNSKKIITREKSQFIMDLLGLHPDITNNSYSDSQLALLEKTAKTKIKNKKTTSIDYKDYGNYDGVEWKKSNRYKENNKNKNTADKFKGFMYPDDSEIINKMLGGATVNKDSAGNITITDRYNYNSKDNSNLETIIGDYTENNATSFKKIRNIGEIFGSNENRGSKTKLFFSSTLPKLTDEDIQKSNKEYIKKNGKPVQGKFIQPGIYSEPNQFAMGGKVKLKRKSYDYGGNIDLEPYNRSLDYSDEPSKMIAQNNINFAKAKAQVASNPLIQGGKMFGKAATKIGASMLTKAIPETLDDQLIPLGLQGLDMFQQNQGMNSFGNGGTVKKSKYVPIKKQNYTPAAESTSTPQIKLNKEALASGKKIVKDDPDSILENLIEIADPTGVSSWDDIYRMASEKGLKHPETMFEIAGAIPFAGKAAKLMKAVKPLVKNSRQMNNLNKGIVLARGVQGVNIIGRGASAKDAGDSFLSDFFAYGGNTSHIPVEVEGEEVMETPNGEVAEFNGPKHEEGGINMDLPEGTDIYSDRISLEGKTMAERKKGRESKIKSINTRLKKNPNDQVLKNTLGRMDFIFQIEDEQDKAIQESIKEIKEGTQKRFQLKDREEFGNGTSRKGLVNKNYNIPQLGPSSQYGKIDNTKYPAIETDDDFINRQVHEIHQENAVQKYNSNFKGDLSTAIQSAIPSGEYDFSEKIKNIQNFASNANSDIDFTSNPNNFTVSPKTKTLFTPTSLGDQIIEKETNPLYNQADLPPILGQMEAKPFNYESDWTKLDTSGQEDLTPSPAKKQKKSFFNPDMGGVGVGDMLAMGGNFAQAYLPMLETLRNRSTDQPNINPYKNFGRNTINTLENEKGSVKQLRDNALTDLTLNATGQKIRNRNGARGINTQRALDLASDQAVNRQQSDIYDKSLSQLLGISDKIASAQTQQDQAVMQGEQYRDVSDRQDKDMFSKEMARNYRNMGEAVLHTGDSLNKIKARKASVNLLAQEHPNFYSDANGNIRARTTNQIATPEERAQYIKDVKKSQKTGSSKFKMTPAEYQDYKKMTPEEQTEYAEMLGLKID